MGLAETSTRRRLRDDSQLASSRRHDSAPFGRTEGCRGSSAHVDATIELSVAQSPACPRERRQLLAGPLRAARLEVAAPKTASRQLRPHGGV